MLFSVRSTLVCQDSHAVVLCQASLCCCKPNAKGLGIRLPVPLTIVAVTRLWHSSLMPRPLQVAFISSPGKLSNRIRVRHHLGIRLHSAQPKPQSYTSYTFLVFYCIVLRALQTNLFNNEVHVVGFGCDLCMVGR